MSKESRAHDDKNSGWAEVVQLFPERAFRGVILPPPELRTDPQMPWVSVDHHREGADWVYMHGAAHSSFVESVELDIPEVSGL